MSQAYPWTKEEAAIIKAAWATEQGALALQLVVEQLGMLHQSSFSSDPHVMAFNEGRRFVARELAAAINMPVKQLVKEHHDDTIRIAEPVTATERAARVASGDWERGGAKRKQR